MKNSESFKGFILVELLVAIAIIGILVGFATVNLIGLRGRARDGERKADLKAIQSALQIYRADQGRFPTAAEYPGCNGPLVAGGSTYLQATPCDPLDTTTTYNYAPAAGGSPQTYTLRACLENINDSEATGGVGTDGCTAGRVPYRVPNP